MSKLLLVDGHNLLFQMFFGMPARILNREGKAIHGILGFIGALIKIIKMTSPTHLAVLFDGEHESARATLDADYKSNRIDYSEVPEEDNPFSQLPGIYAALDYMGVRHAEVSGGETDDAVASYAIAFGGEMEILISSFDSDFFQLITDTVRVLRYRGDRSILCGKAYLSEKYGVSPEQYADFKALTGDAADNIRGVRGVGPKTAAALIRQFGTLEQVISRPEQIAKPSVRAAVENNTERLLLNKRMIRLDDQTALPFEIEELEFAYTGLRTAEVLTGAGLR